MLFFENFQSIVPSAESLERWHAMLQDEEPALEIEVAQHLADQVGIGRIFSMLQHIEQLRATHREQVDMVRIDRHVRGKIIKLRPRARVVLCAQHHRDRRGIQMK